MAREVQSPPTKIVATSAFPNLAPSTFKSPAPSSSLWCAWPRCAPSRVFYKWSGRDVPAIFSNITSPPKYRSQMVNLPSQSLMKIREMGIPNSPDLRGQFWSRQWERIRAADSVQRPLCGVGRARTGGRTLFFRVGRRKQEGMQDFGPDFGRTFPRTPEAIPGTDCGSIAVRNKKPPAFAGGSSLHSWGNLPIEQQ
jgi:hypothetical protein